MSRCFPPCCFAKIAANMALMEPIKIQREAEKAAKAKRKHDRKLEKALRSQKKESKKKTFNPLGKRKLDDEKKPHNLDFGKDGTTERSNITEELGGQPSNHQNNCNSDSSENSMLSLETNNGGSLMKTRLTPQKSVRRRLEFIDNESTTTTMNLVSLLYRDIVTDFSPLQLGSSLSNELADNSLSWLIDRRDAPKLERCKPKSDAIWAKARYLPEVELHALPYVVPF